MPENPYAAALAWLGPLSSAFGKRTWRRALVLVAGAILAQGPRTVAAALRAAGLGTAPGFCGYHRVLSRRRWSGRAAARLLLAELLRAFVPPGAPVVVGLDETLERRWGRRIAARGIYRDPVRSSPRRRVRPPGAPVHRPRRGAGGGSRLVRPALVGGGDLRRGPAAPRHGDAAAVVGRRRRARHAPALLGLFSLVALRASDLHARGALPHRRTAWYPKEEPTFSDALAAVRRSLWVEAARFPASPRAADRVEVPRSVLDRLTDLACHAA
jgi:DDE superfamily endonuclease